MTNMRLRYRRIGVIGEGASGKVYRAVLENTGQLVAVKIVRRHGTWISSIGEESIQPSLDHPHILSSFHTQGWDTPRVEIFTELMEGSLAELVESLDIHCMLLATDVLYQMLQALYYLAGLGYVHRDVKPQNIFYTTRSRRPSSAIIGSPQTPPYHFRLGDFGLCVREDDDDTWSIQGTVMYLPPEVFDNAGSVACGRPQSHKSDVWALYVSILWVLDVGGLRAAAKTGVSMSALMPGFLAAPRVDGRVAMLGGMARRDPWKRATAGEVLARCFEEEEVAWEGEQ
ncbi:hypothetical protein VTI74DRAFT_9334 [Chaetomium olivicolor]